MNYKFRAWDGKEMHYNVCLNHLGKAIKFGYRATDWVEDANAGIPMMFTDHQVNGVDLYESDILRNEIMDDDEDAVEYLVCVFIREWAMFGLLTIDEYHTYNQVGADGLDEYMFWTFPIEDKENEQRRICGNIYENKNLLETT